MVKIIRELILETLCSHNFLQVQGFQSQTHCSEENQSKGGLWLGPHNQGILVGSEL